MDVRGFDLQRVAEEVLLRLVYGDIADRQDALQGDGAECADHEQGTMGEVHNAQCAEDQCQAKRDQRIGRPLVQTV